jgi:uroporphyrinogen-III decarboxylase
MSISYKLSTIIFAGIITVAAPLSAELRIIEKAKEKIMNAYSKKNEVLEKLSAEFTPEKRAELLEAISNSDLTWNQKQALIGLLETISEIKGD